MVQLALKRPYSDDTTHFFMTDGEFLEKLMALIPPPKSHLVKLSGSFAPNSKFRKKIFLNPEQLKGFHLDQDEEEKPRKNDKWAELLGWVFGIDILKCYCGGELKPVAALKDPREITRCA